MEIEWTLEEARKFAQYLIKEQEQEQSEK